MLTFDLKGFLVPDRVIPASLNEFEDIFVTSQPDETRSQLFDNFLFFLSKLFSDLNLTEVNIWINGSFTTRKRNPNDIDIVIHLPFYVQKQHEAILKSTYSNEVMLTSLHLDIFFVAVFPESHPNHFLTKSDQAYWVEKFGRTRPDHRRRVYKKGILELNIEMHEIR